MIENVLYYLENSAKNYPEKIAIIEEEKSISYANLLLNSKAVGTGLSRFDVLRRKTVIMSSGGYVQCSYRYGET